MSIAEDTGVRSREWVLRLRAIPVLGHFADKSFFHYFWTGGLFTLLNIFLVWLSIDIFHIPTIISSVVVIGGLFLGRYLVFRWLGVL